MDKAEYNMVCQVTDNEAFISGKRHVLVIKPNGIRFFMGEFFLAVMNGMNDADIAGKLAARYGVPDEYVTRAIEVVLKGGFVSREDGP